MRKLDTEKIRKAFIDAALQDFESISTDSSRNWEADDRFVQSLHNMAIQPRYRKQRTKRRTLIILVALLIIALTSCAAIYHVIRGFIVTAFQTHDKIEQADSVEGRSANIEDSNLLMLEIDGYVLKSSLTSRYYIHAVWEHCDGNTIAIVQSVTSQTTHRMDSEQSDRSIRIINGCQVISYRYGGQRFSYIWSTKYHFSLDSSVELSDELLKKIINFTK